ncbi:MAG: alpha/beta hydrolase [Burkholderiales bacterium]|nr:alpha/beta hydrolase [Burkholderiales bacterium]
MPAYDPAWLDRMYNNRALVPEHAVHFARWGESSRQARASWPCELDLAYGDGPNETLDVFPAAQPNSPVVVFIHGGYWRSLDKSDHSFVAPALTEAGACVVVPNYALCPAVTIPQITLQMVRALAWTWRHAARYGGDPSRITVIGHSAGGHLAAMLLTCAWKAVSRDLPAQLVKDALSISGLYELESIMHTPFVQGDLRLTPAQVLKASPAWLPAPSRGVLFTVAGADESAEFLRHNTLIQQAWGTAVVPVCEALPGLNHFSVLETLTQPTQRLHQLARQLIG